MMTYSDMQVGAGCVIREMGGSFEGVQRLMASDNILTESIE
jgi:hypothetical protein